MELIKDRLAHIIRAKNLTATQFAEMMQIQPSNVSHLLSGRNKPSLDFLIKLKDVFPEYSFDWIILGKKPITISDRQQVLKEDTFNTIDLSQNIENNTFDGLLNMVEDNIATSEIMEDKMYSVQSNQPKKVKQIIYIYEDHTFEMYELKKYYFYLILLIMYT